MIEKARDEVLAALVTALARASDDGSPVASLSVEQRKEIAVTALRRIRSFGRRHISIDDRTRCVHDLAKGLADFLEAQPHLVGPLMKDYQFIASGLLDAYTRAGGS